MLTSDEKAEQDYGRRRWKTFKHDEFYRNQKA